MATTYTLISSNVLTGSAASVTFSSIPSTYTDLVLRYSARTDVSGIADGIDIKLNSDTSTNYSYTYIRANGSTVASFNSSNQTKLTIPNGGANGATATASTFGSVEIYFPNYIVAENKPNSVFGVTENNATSAQIQPLANLWRNSAAITSITLTSNNAANFDSGSSFYLYGIKNS